MNDLCSIDTGWCEVLVKRTKRQNSVSIKVKEGRVQINVPSKMAAIDVQLLLEKKRTWIERALAKQRIALKATTKHLEPGELFLYQGKRYPLRFEKGESQSVYLSNDNHLTMVCSDFSNQHRLFKQLVGWYQNQATAYLLEKTEYYAQKLGHFPASVGIKSYRARWGSCSGHGEIQYNWRLIMATQEVIDYVVVHELCHLVEHNHSSRFWQLVASLDDDYQIHRQWLKQYGDYLHIQLAKT